ncbi:carbohydrate ABC transporter permease [Maribius pontilimi]|uniref:Carbohydrate ABC transporter permease n=1 Tax=Palleronia pontilimi TaxID=1964209 RepID=A0A934IGL5_9RHOB|nr:carbohydrate ABC transporter permease [Palleronia pontilimi]MBJ3763045.1 carbohydrate ABC transporter permease [Palleronia pontilimi]
MDNIAGTKSSLTWATHLSVLVLVLLWLIPTIGLFVSSFRDRDQISASGWWEAPFPVELTARGRTATEATLEGDVYVVTGNIYDDPEAQSYFPGGGGEVVAFGTSGREPGAFPAGEPVEIGDGETLVVNADGTYEWRTTEEPDRGQRVYFAAESPPDFTLDNYEQVLTADNMTQAFVNTFIVTVPATIIPILIAAFAAYALAWMDFPGRGVLIALVVGLLVVPLQLALVPMLNLHNKIGIGQSFMGIWFAHTAFGMPLAVYLLRNYMVGLPRDIIESAKVDGATDFELFVRIILPLSLPALAAFSIFQFLWTWNDLLVAKVFLPSDDASKVMTVKIADDLLGSRGGDWGILATAAFVSIAVPLVVFFTMQRFLVRGLLAGSVK